MSQNKVIGKDGTIPWRCSEDLKWFKEFTLNKTIVVGRTTFEKLPPLRDRRILILTRSPSEHFNSSEWYDVKRNVHHQLITDINDIPNDAIIAGGATVYRELLPYCSELYLTIIKQTVEGDTEMPAFAHLFRYVEELRNEESFSILRLYK